ncbi:MAG: hypothetical protein EZS28_004910 [Streblomastix strix]|uniref:Uncharacterized protein n=1 Tax=Streblomastix strix TaxID=222440 RepID=A0A5J4WYZ0_9EUKA|nr:MAG: hypothetical protein EZS28_004910 [Streblomastix strix]
MCIAGRVIKHIKIRETNNQEYQDTKRNQMMNIINSEDRFSEEKGLLFIASVKGHIDKNHINDNINFPPIWRKRTYKTDKKTVDYCHFIIDDVEEIVLFTKHTAFKSFVEVMAEKCYQAMREGNQAKQLYFKNIVNSSYGADGQNNEKFDKIAISGSIIEGYKQQFKLAIKDQEFWDEHYKEWLPWERCAIAEEKKLLGCAIESQRESIICLAPKCYSAIDGEIEDVIRMKGINEKNSGLTRDDYFNSIENNSNVSVPVTQIQLKNGVMSMKKITKSALTRVADKIIVIDSDNSKGQSYLSAPQIMNVDASSYHYV